MSRVHIAPADRNTVQVFQLDAGDEQQATEFAATGLERAFGIDTLDHFYVQALRVEDVSAIGLSTYLEQGMGVDPAELEGHRATLDAAEGWVLLIDGQAFGGREVELNVAPPLTYLGGFRNVAPAGTMEKLTSDSAQGQVPPAAPAPAAPPKRGPRAGAFVILAIVILVGLVLAAFFGAG